MMLNYAMSLEGRSVFKLDYGDRRCSTTSSICTEFSWSIFSHLFHVWFVMLEKSREIEALRMWKQGAEQGKLPSSLGMATENKVC